MTKIVDDFANRGPRRLHFTATGEGHAIVLLPGIGRGMGLFGTLPRRFARRGFRAITYDPIGVAPSSALEGPFLFEDAAEDVWAVVDAAGEREVDLVGTSLGGKVALVVAARRPERVRRVVLLGTSAVVSARARRIYRFFRTVAEHVPQSRFADVVAPFVFGRTFHETRPMVVDDIARASRPDEGKRTLMIAQAEALQDFDGSAFARAVTAPTLCIAGAEDTLTDAADVRATAALLPAGSYEEVRRAGHSLLLKDARAYELVEGFLRP